MGRKPKNTKIVSQETPEQFELPNMPEKDTKKMTDLEIAVEKCKRNAYGLLENLEYKFKEDGSIDWLKMIPSDLFYARKESFGPDVDINSLDVSELPDDKKVMKLDAIKWILEKGNAENIEFKIGAAYPEYAATTCIITWGKSVFHPNGLVTSGNGEAHAFNNVPPFKYLLSTLSENKSLCRATRLFANISTVYGADELRGEPVEKEDSTDKSGGKSYGVDPNSFLKKTMDECNFSFDKVKSLFISSTSDLELHQKARNWTKPENVDIQFCFDLISRMKRIHGHTTLNELISSRGFTFEKIKARFIETCPNSEKKKAEIWNCVEDIDTSNCWEIINKINSKK